MRPLLKALWTKTRASGQQALDAAASVKAVRRRLDRLSTALDRALTPAVPATDDFYGRGYFVGEKHSARGKTSGYADYARENSHADVLAQLLVDGVPGARMLDVGCARGFLVEALLERGRDAWGCDGSLYAVNSAARGARGRLHHADLRGRLPFDDRSFDVVTAFETLEHVPPADVPHAVAELARLSRDFVVVTIPSFGPRPPLPSGWFDAKVRPDRVEHYRALGPSYDGPVPAEDLAVDAEGQPVEGHVCIASFAWWRRQFEAAGLRADPALDEWAHRQLEPHGLHVYLDWMTFRARG
jgi:SAM-dependent methyltransferase